MTKKLEGTVRTARRRRRGSLRPALTGLTVFSLTCLVLGSAVYAAAVPGLVMSSDTVAAAVQAPASPAAGSQRIMASILSGLIGGSASDGEGASGEGAAEGDAASSGGSGGVATIGGLSSLTSIVGGSLQGAADLSSDDGAEQPEDSSGAHGSDADNGDSSQGDASDGDHDQGQDPSPENPGGDETPEPTPEPDPGPTPEEEAEYHDNLVGYANGLNNYVARIAESRAYFEGGWNAPVLSLSSGSIESMYVQSQVLRNDVMGAWGSLQKAMAYKEDSQWRPAAEDLIRMYMLLVRYSEGLMAAWGAAVDASSHDELLAYWPQIVGTIEEAQQYLDEFNKMADAGVAL